MRRPWPTRGGGGFAVPPKTKKICIINQQMHYSDSLSVYSAAPTCFDI
jgi:hypothetical protein